MLNLNCTFSFELLMMDGKTRPKHVERLTKISKLRNVALVVLSGGKTVFECRILRTVLHVVVKK